MGYKAGDMTSVFISNSNYGAKEMYPNPDQDINISLPGVTSESLPTAKPGVNTSKMTRVNGKIDGMVIACNLHEDLPFLQNLVGDDTTVFTFTHISGEKFAVTGQITDQPIYNANNATVPLNISILEYNQL